MANTTHLRVITPEGIFYDSNIHIVTLRTSEGNIGLQHGKTPLVASIEISELSIVEKQGEKGKICAIAGGIVYATPSSIQIITDAIEYENNIELSRAEKNKKLAEAKLKQKLTESEYQKAKVSLRKAINRISIKNSI